MPEPVYSAKAELLWSRLPERVRADDADRSWPFKALVALIGDRTDNVSALLDRFTRLPARSELRRGLAAGKYATSDLIDPTAADPAWLAWLGQIPGVRVTPAMSTQARRDAIEGAVSGWNAGTAKSIADAARSALIGLVRYVRVYNRSIAAVGDGGRWDVMVVTRASETPSIAAVQAAVLAANAVPIGVLLHYKAYSATFAQIRASLGADTFAAWQAAFPTFQDATDYLPPGA